MATMLQLHDFENTICDRVDDWITDGQPDDEMLVITDHGNEVVTAELRTMPFELAENEDDVDVASLVYDGEPDIYAIQALAEKYLFIAVH